MQDFIIFTALTPNTFPPTIESHLSVRFFLNANVKAFTPFVKNQHHAKFSLSSVWLVTSAPANDSAPKSSMLFLNMSSTRSPWFLDNPAEIAFASSGPILHRHMSSVCSVVLFCSRIAIYFIPAWPISTLWDKLSVVSA